LAHTLKQLPSPPALDDIAAPLSAGRDFERLYTLYFGFTWRVLRHLGVPLHAVDDVVQEVWIVVHQRMSDFEGRSSLKTWLFGITFNVMRNQRRAEERRSKLLDIPLLQEPPRDPEIERLGREAWERVERFLATLDELNRAIFVSSLLELLPAKETAEATGVDVGTVYQRIRSLRQRFKTWLEAHDAQPEAGA
jgi:RNA polymerase sigma-70 factor (ECF subfamily)